ncbi:peptidylprolyl isomerase [Rapidithrix thailandica]|uniref:Peptidylprolyl isomerase n=1 Tax=Rapidithrix thailandica TaxID=413964 RepID=A0AAW9S8P7_9BACT
MNRVLWVLLILGFTSCDNINSLISQNTEGQNPVARVDNKYLFEKDLKGLLPERSRPEDSVNIVERYIDTWIKKQLMLKHAEKNLAIDEAEIERRVQEYRFQLIIYAFEKKYVEENLDTLITDEQVKTYYEENLDNFELKQNIVKGVFLKVPKEAPKTKQVKKWLQKWDTDKQREKLNSYAYSYASIFHLNDSVWINFDEMIANTPFPDQISNKVQVLRKQRFLEASDSAYVYYFRINDSKIADQTSPLEYVDMQIRDILMNKRKLALTREFENKIFNEARRKNEYEIYN